MTWQENEKDIVKIKETLRWHWIVVGAYAFIFGGLLTWYLPKELDQQKTAIIDEMKLAIGKVLVPALNNLSLPEDKIPTAPQEELQNRFKKTADLIDGALSGAVPVDPKLLMPTKSFLLTSLKSRDLSTTIRTDGISALIHVYGFETFSSDFLHARPTFSLINVRIIGFPTAIRLSSTTAGNVIVYGSTIIRATSQALDGVKWIKTTFDQANLTYGGGDVYMADVVFKDCTFHFADDVQSRALLRKLQDSQRQQMPATVLFVKEDQSLNNLYSDL